MTGAEGPADGASARVARADVAGADVAGPTGGGATVEVTVRYWASARAAAGCDTECLTGHRVGEVLAKAGSAHPGLGVVLRLSSILLDGRPVTASQVLPAGATLEVLPPFAGG